MTKHTKQSAKLHSHVGMISLVGGVLLVVVVAIMLSGVLSGGHEAERQRIELQARVERLEFCVNHGISPCGPEKLKEWNNAHEPHERFWPQFDGSFAQ